MAGLRQKMELLVICLQLQQLFCINGIVTIGHREKNKTLYILYDNDDIYFIDNDGIFVGPFLCKISAV